MKPGGCNGCPLYTIGQGFTRPRGNPIYGVGLLGEAPGEEEAKLGQPFQGKAGKMLSRMLARTRHPSTGVALQIDDFLVHNTLSCRPPDNLLTKAPYEAEALHKCRQHLAPVLSDPRVKVWFALGNQALRALTGEWGIDSRRLRGYTFDGPYGTKVVGSYHPSYLMKGQFKLVKVWQADLIKALRLGEGALETQRTVRYTLYPSADDLRAFRDEWIKRGRPLLSFDIETPYDEDEDGEDKDGDFVAIEDTASYTILRISLSFEEGTAITMPWQEPFIGLVREILGMAVESIGWNSLTFDIPRLEANGVVVAGRHIDGMLAWHALEPALPMSLKYVAPLIVPDVDAWATRSSSDKEYYNAADSDIALVCANYIRRKLEEQGRWGMFERHFVDLYQVLRAMSRRGLNVDIERRRIEAAKLETRFSETVGQLQGMVPTEILPRKAYKKPKAQLEKAGLWDEARMIEVTE